MIRIVDYGMGNLRSVQKAFEWLGHPAVLTRNPADVKDAERLALPGVGAFGAAMANLEQYGLIEPVRNFIYSGRPFLGICLGMQLLLTESEEQGHYSGLDIIPGKVVKFFDRSESSENLKVPHIGWNTIKKVRNCPIPDEIPDDAGVYFVHSYYVEPQAEAVAAKTGYGIEFCSVIQSGNIFATQFHPEKSGKVGLKILDNFAKIK